jgi:hypothetical protein
MQSSIRLALLAVLLLRSAPAYADLIYRGGGLVYDDVLNITWLQDANFGAGSIYDSGVSTTDGRMLWANAAAWADNLSYFDSVRNTTWLDWRLPSVSPIGTSVLTTTAQTTAQRIMAPT